MLVFVLATLSLFALVALLQAHTLPQAVQLGSAIVAAVEQDAEQESATEERMQREWLQIAEQQLHKFLNDELTAEDLNNIFGTWASEARGKHQKKKYKKLLKMLYPLLVAAALAKMVLLPLILKWLTALSTSSFIMGKIALFTSGLLALKWIMSSGHAHDRLEIIHSSSPSIKGYHAAHAADLSSSGSSWMPLRSQHYIPLGITKDTALRHAQHNYDNQEFYKPFL